MDTKQPEALTPWPSRPDQINPAMLDDIARRVSAAIPDGENGNMQPFAA